PPQGGLTGVLQPLRPVDRTAVQAGLRGNRRGGPRGDVPPEEAARRLEGAEDEVVMAAPRGPKVGSARCCADRSLPRVTGLRQKLNQPCRPAGLPGAGPVPLAPPQWVRLP